MPQFAKLKLAVRVLISKWLQRSMHHQSLPKNCINLSTHCTRLKFQNLEYFVHKYIILKSVKAIHHDGLYFYAIDVRTIKKLPCLTLRIIYALVYWYSFYKWMCGIKFRQKLTRKTYLFWTDFVWHNAVICLLLYGS